MKSGIDVNNKRTLREIADEAYEAEIQSPVFVTHYHRHKLDMPLLAEQLMKLKLSELINSDALADEEIIVKNILEISKEVQAIDMRKVSSCQSFFTYTKEALSCQLFFNQPKKVSYDVNETLEFWQAEGVEMKFSHP